MTTAYMLAIGAKQGEIKGDVAVAGRVGTIPLLSVAHAIAAPFDLAKGTISGRAQFQPITITKGLDQATPALVQALLTNEVLTTVEINFYRAAADGKETAYFRFDLTRAALISHDLALREGGDSSEIETVRMVCETIAWAYWGRLER